MSAPGDACALRSALVAGELSVREAVAASLAAAEASAPLGAFAALDAERALERAGGLDAARRSGEPPGPLFGVPLALKGNMCREGLETSCGSRMLAGWRPPYTATFVRRLEEAGAVVVGTTHMDEFAMGSSGERSAFAVTRNPWDPARTPGGSSSGSAVAVASGAVPLALGSDTGGSVRQPAAMCGISGFKPTWGRVSRYGLVAFASSLDQTSPLARSVRDLEACFRAMAGHDPLDATSLDAPLAPPAEAELAGLRIGVPREHLSEALHPGVRAAVEAALAELEQAGARLVPLSLPHTDVAIAAYYLVSSAEAASNLARFDGVRYGLRVEGDGSLQGMIAATRAAGFGPEVKRRILLGTYALSSGYHDLWYGRASAARRLVARDFDEAFAAVDVVAGPTSPVPAFRLGEREDPLAMYACDVLTAPASLAGLPALGLPCGLAEESGALLPVGLQLVGPRLADERLLAVGRAFQERTAHHLARPPRAPASPAQEAHP